MLVTNHIETRDESHERSGFEFQNRGNESHNFDVEFRAFARAAAYHTPRRWVLYKTYNALYRTKKVHQSRNIIRSHVKDWPSALSIEELRTRMPAFRTAAHEKSGTPDRPPDYPIIHQFAGCL